MTNACRMVISQTRCRIFIAKLEYALRLTTLTQIYATVGYKCSKRAPVKQFYKGRREFGGFANHIDRLLKYGTEEIYKAQFGMTRSEYESLYIKVRPALEPKKYAPGTSISAREKLVLTLSYLKSGCSQGFLANQFMISRCRVSVLIRKTLEVLVEHLAVEADFRPRSAECWKAIARRYYERWQLPQCIGSVDGKHCFITKFGRTGSYTINYKGWPSVVLLAVCDADYIIRHFNVGSFGGRSDGGIWSEDRLGRGLASGELLEQGFIPAAEPLPGDEQGHLGDVNFYVVGDEAFKLHPHCMKPYGGKISKTMRTTNYRLSRARITIECVFGHLSRRWRILNHLTTSEKVTRLIVRCCVHLHNFLRISRFHDSDELKLIENVPPETFGHSLAVDPVQDPAVVQDPVNSGEKTRTKLHYYFNYVNPIPRHSE